MALKDEIINFEDLVLPSDNIKVIEILNLTLQIQEQAGKS